MPTIKEIKNRRNSIQSTSQITKAMKLVSTVKLQRTKEAAQNALPYFDTMYKTVTQILSKSMNLNHKYITPNNKDGKVALVVISSNRGLAGGYNSNIIRKIIGNDKVFDFDKNTTLIYSIGSKARDQLKMKGFTIEKDYSDIIENNNYSLYTMITNDLLSDFSNGKITIVLSSGYSYSVLALIVYFADVIALRASFIIESFLFLSSVAITLGIAIVIITPNIIITANNSINVKPLLFFIITPLL